MPTILDLAFDGNYVMSLRRSQKVLLEMYTYNGGLYCYNPQLDKVLKV